MDKVTGNKLISEQDVETFLLKIYQRFFTYTVITK